MSSRRIFLVLPALVPVSLALAATTPPPVFDGSWGGTGTTAGKFGRPLGLTVASGNLYAIDAENGNVQVFTPAGEFVARWGTAGTGEGEFTGPWGLDSGPGGVIYVADTGNSRIQKFTADGTFLTQWGSYGLGEGQFETVVDVAVDASGDVYTSELNAGRIQKFTADGDFILSWGPATDVGPLGQIVGIATWQGTVYVADVNHHRVVRFDSDGNATVFMGTGQGEGQVTYPIGVSVDPNGFIYVTDYGACGDRCRVQKVATNGVVVSVWGSVGTGDGQFDTAFDTAVIGASVYVSDFSPRIQRFTFTVPIEPTTWGRLKSKY